MLIENLIRNTKFYFVSLDYWFEASSIDNDSTLLWQKYLPINEIPTTQTEIGIHFSDSQQKRFRVAVNEVRLVAADELVESLRLRRIGNGSICQTKQPPNPEINALDNLTKPIAELERKFVSADLSRSRNRSRDKSRISSSRERLKSSVDKTNCWYHWKSYTKYCRSPCKFKNPAVDSKLR